MALAVVEQGTVDVMRRIRECRGEKLTFIVFFVVFHCCFSILWNSIKKNEKMKCDFPFDVLQFYGVAATSWLISIPEALLIFAGV